MRTVSLLALSLFTFIATAQEFRWDKEEIPTPAEEPVAEDQLGTAGFYADYYEGNPTALGETYRGTEFTAAHATLPLGTMVEVSRLDNGMSTIVRINDRGAYCEDCLIDLSRVAAEEIDLLREERIPVKIKILGYAEENPTIQVDESRFVPKKVTPSDYQRRQPTNSTPGPRIKARTPLPQAQPKSTSGGMQARGVTNAGSANGQVQILTNSPGGYVVQLGSYEDFGNAERHVRSLQGKGFNNLYVLPETRADGSAINRVVVFPFPSATAAQNYLADLQSYHQMTGLVVRMD